MLHARLAANTGCKKSSKICHLDTIAQLCRAISLQLRRISTIGKNFLSSYISSTCHHNMANFGPLTAKIGLPVWGTPANFNRLRVLAALLHSTLVVGVEQRVPPIFGRAAITLGIGSLFYRLISAVANWMSTILPHMVWP